MERRAALRTSSSPDIDARLSELQDAEDTHRAETIDEPPNEDQGIRRPRIYKPFDLPVLLILAPASIFGVLARLGLVALTTFDGESVFPLLYVQATGCLVMGFGLSIKEPLGNYYGPFYTAITTGFCGSLTTFSGWQMDVFNAWIDAKGFHRGGLRNFVDGVGISTFTLSVSLASISFGYGMGCVARPYLSFPSFPPLWQRCSITLISALAYGATIFTYFLLPVDVRYRATAALIFSYPGTLTRYCLSIALNPRYKALPSGTLFANTLGTALVASCHVLQNLDSPLSKNACAILQGLIDGYCGCLTTVSTFAAEVRDLGRWKACRYVAVSWVLGQLAVLLILGPSMWTGHAEKQITCTFV